MMERQGGTHVSVGEGGTNEGRGKRRTCEGK